MVGWTAPARGSDPIPATQGESDGCGPIPILPHWAAVSVDSTRNPAVLEGYARVSRVTHEDFPYQHDSHDWITLVEPDPGSDWMLSSAATGDHRTPWDKGMIEIEWDIAHFPRSVWPMATEPLVLPPPIADHAPLPLTPAPTFPPLPDGRALPKVGDRVWMMGTLVWDCGHGDGGHLTELHPPQAVAFTHYEPVTLPGDRLPSIGTRTTVYVHGIGGNQDLVGINHDIATDSGRFSLFDRDYDIPILVPPRPSPAAELRVVVQPDANTPTPTFVTVPDESRVDLHFPLTDAIRSDPTGRFSAVVLCGWHEPQLSRTVRELRVTLDRVHVFKDHDGPDLHWLGIDDKGEWQLWGEVAGRWHELLRTADAPYFPPEGEVPADSGDVGDDSDHALSGLSWTALVADDGFLSIQTAGWESDAIDNEFGTPLAGIAAEFGVDAATLVNALLNPRNTTSVALSAGRIWDLLHMNDPIGVVSRIYGAPDFGVGSHDDLSQATDGEANGDFRLSYHIEPVATYPAGSVNVVDIAPREAWMRASDGRGFGLILSQPLPPGTTVQWHHEPSALGGNFFPASGDSTRGRFLSGPSIPNDGTLTLGATITTNGVGVEATPATIHLLADLHVSPPAVEVSQGQTVSFSVSPATGVAWSVAGDPAAVGSIDPGSGDYRAPTALAADGFATVRATAADGSGRTAEATVVLRAPLTIVPPSVALLAGGSQRFVVSPPIPVTWSIVGGGPGQMGDPASPTRIRLGADVAAYEQQLSQLTIQADLAAHCASLVLRGNPNNPTPLPAECPSGPTDSDALRRELTSFRAANDATYLQDRAQLDAIDSTYHAPPTIPTSQTVTIRAASVDDPGRSATATVFLASTLRDYLANGGATPSIANPLPEIVGADGTLIATDAAGPPGGVAVVDLDVDNRVTALAGLTLDLAFDPSLVLTSDDIESGSLLASPITAYNTAVPGHARLAWMSAGNGSGPGTLARLRFHLPEHAAPGAQYPVRISSLRAADPDGGGVSLGHRDGTITVALPASGTGGLIARQEGGWVEGAATVRIEADAHVADLAGLTLAVGYDPSLTLGPGDIETGGLFDSPTTAFNASTPGVARLGFLSMKDSNGPGVLARLHFHLSPAAKPGARLAVSLDAARASTAAGEAVPLTLTGTTLVVPGGGRRKGDVNGDGSVTIADAILALQFAVGLAQPDAASEPASDANGDGKVTIADVTLVLRAAVGLIQL